MTTIRASTVFRIQNVPSAFTVEDLEQILCGELSDDEARRVKVNVTFVPSCYTTQRNTKCALVEFKPTPGFLQHVEKDVTGSKMVYLEVGDGTITVDVNFYGFTQLYDVEETGIIADIVAVTGLGGHAYGSWRGKETKKMWLRDFLAHDLPNCRTMIYGYNSNLKSRGFHTLKDYKKEFLQEIARIRTSEESLVEAATKKGEKIAFVGNEYLVAATCAVMFFGTPHRGILMEDVRKMLEDDNRHPRIGLLDEIESELNLKPYLKEFIKLAENFKVVSFYERLQTAEVAKNLQNKYTRSGKFKSTLDTDSAVLHLPDHLEETIPVNADHTSIVKFEYKDRTYEAVVKRVHQYMETAPDHVKERFCALDARPGSPLSFSYSPGTFLKIAGIIEPLIYACTKGYAMLSDARNVEDLGNLQMRRNVANQKFTVWTERIQLQSDGICNALGPASGKYVLVVEILAKIAECFRKFDDEFMSTSKSKQTIAASSSPSGDPESSTSESVVQQVRRRLIIRESNLKFWSESNSFNNSPSSRQTLALPSPGPIRNFPAGTGRSSWIPKAAPAAPVMTPVIGLSSYGATGVGSLRFPSATMLTQLDEKDEDEVLRVVGQFKENGKRFQEVFEVSTWNKARWALHNRGKDDLIKIVSELESHNNDLFKITENVKHVRGVSVSKPLAASAQVDFKVRVDLPFLRNPKFCGRDDILDKLSKILEPRNPTPKTGKYTRTKSEKKSVVLHGLGGTGKSQIALEYAYRYSDFYTAIFWIDSNDSSRTDDSAFKIVEQLVAHYAAKQQSSSDFQEIAKNLGIEGKIDPVSGKLDPSAAKLAIKTVHTWLSISGNYGWLLLVDNYENAELSELDKLIPKCDWGNVIVTTRFPNIDRFGECVAVEEIGSEAGLNLLVKSSGKLLEDLDASDLDVAEEIVRTLGEHPLALDQAGAFIRSLQKSFRDYLHRLEKGMKASFKKKVSEVGLPPEKASVLTTWELSIEQLDEHARHLLHLCAFLSNEDIPEELFRRGNSAVLDWIEEDDDALDDAIESLFNLSLAKRKHSSDSFWIHPLVHTWTRERNDSTIRRQYAEESITLITSAIVRNTGRTFENWIFERRILSHLNVCQNNISEYFSRPCTIEAIKASDILASTYADLGYYNQAQDSYRKVLEWQEEMDGSDHPSTLITMNNMGFIFRIQGRYGEALKRCQKALSGLRTALGTDHPSTLEAMNNLALIFSIQGRHDEALELFQEALAGMEKVLGGDHLLTLQTIRSIATVFYYQGRCDESIDWYYKALAGMEKKVGNNHPLTLETMDIMAGVLYEQRRYGEAMEFYQNALVGNEKVLGNEHPSTLRTMNHIAGSFREDARYDDALKLYQKVLAGKERTFGIDHPSTLMTVDSIAAVFHMQGRYHDAIELYQKVLAWEEKVHGSDHHSTLETMSNIAIIFDRQKKSDKALEWYQKALAGKEKTLGSDHPSTMETMDNMADFFFQQERYDEALEWHQKVLEWKEKTLDSDDISTVDTMHCIAIIFEKQGRYDEALESYQKALTWKEKELGSDNSFTLVTMNDMANIFQRQGRFHESIEWYQKALAGFVKEVGNDHPLVLNTMSNIATGFTSLGRYDEAFQWCEKTLAGREKMFGSEHPSTLDSVRLMADIFDKLGQHGVATETVS
ncbi:hypothetical protein RUND412_009495 [Rhizina undulata]